MADKAKQLYDAAHGIAVEAGRVPVLHVRVLGRSRDIALEVLHVDRGSTDEIIRNAVAQFMEVAPAQLRNTVIERHENGNITVRPEAIFG